MTNVLLYSVQPLLVAGFQVILDRLPEFEGSVATNLADLLDRMPAERPQLVLLEVTSAAGLDLLHNVIAIDRNAAVILWVDEVTAEFASQAIALGVRGLLRKGLSIELQARCLERVAAGELWIEKALSDKLLCTRRVALAPRERQLIVLLAQGLKNKEIAYTLGITEGTVKVYLRRLFEKTGANDRLDLAVFGLKNLFGNRTGEAKGPVPTAAFVPSFICVDRGRFGPRAAAM
jgi:DNA-binding NarL/FixJ family response regulator